VLIRKLGVLGAILVGAACHVTRGDPTGFRAALECGLSQQQVAAVARQFGASALGCPPPPSVPRSKCFVEFGRVSFDLEFDSSGSLTTVVRGELYGLKGLDLMPEENLCASEPEPSLSASPEATQAGTQE